MSEKSAKEFFLEKLAEQTVLKFTHEYRNQGNKIVNFANTGHELDAERIDAIRQKQSKGFTVYDINPNNLERTDWPCAYQSDVLGRIIGFDFSQIPFGTVLDTVPQPNGPPYAPVPYFRTIEINKPGNWLKVEFLPSRASPGIREPLDPPPMNRVSDIPQNDTNTENFWEYAGGAVISASRNLALVDFETTSTTPHLINETTCFETYFSTVFVTVKQWNQIVRVTIGYNSKIISEKEYSPLHLGDSGSMKNQLSLQTPFCISQRDLYDSTYQGPAVSNIPAVQYFPLIRNSLEYFVPFENLQTNVGVCVFWITDFKCIYAKYNDNNKGTWEGELVIGRYDPSSLNSLPSFVIKRILSSVTTIYSNSTAPAVINPNVCEPVRVTLRAGECLYFRSTATSVAAPLENVGVSYNLSGYGPPFYRTTISGGTMRFFEPTNLFSEHPNPVDVGTIRAPRR